MKLLLDSHALIWALFAAPQLSEGARAALENQGNTVLVSPVSVYELEVKRALGKFPFPAIEWEKAISAAGFELLAPNVPTWAAAARLPLHHRDPWDRLLIAQALDAGATFVTSDSFVERYGVPTLW